MRPLGMMSVALVAGIALAHPPRAAGADEVVAKVNDRPIMRSELDRELLIQHGQEVLEKIIARHALRQDMAARGIEVTDAEVDAAVEIDREAIRATYGDRCTLEEIVDFRLDMNMESYREEVVRLRLYMERSLRGRIRPDEADLMLFFAAHRRRYDVPAQAKVRHLLVAVEPGASRRRWQEARLKAERLRRQAAGGVDFAKLVRLRSDDKATRRKGGLLGVVASNDERITEDLRKVIFSLRPGQIGGPVMGREGYRLVQVMESMPGRRVDFEKVKERVRADYVKAKLDEEAKLYIKRLMAEADIVKRLRVPGRVTPRPVAVASRADPPDDPDAAGPAPGPERPVRPAPPEKEPAPALPPEVKGREEEEDEWPTFRK